MTFLAWNQIILQPFVRFITTTCEKHQFMKIFFRMFLKITKPLKCLPVVLVSSGCYYSSQTHLLINPSEMYSLKILLTICLKPRAMPPPETLKENLSLPRPTSCGWWHSLGFGHLSAPFSHFLILCVPNLPLPLLRTYLGWHLGPTQIIQDNFI